ncbi:uncharacterized protein LOC125230635 isoform X2 [Leguminivora glycinivorella]|uniref:uncharacterized protein LOC125230635 isoform X2 n=1 Tax=Leguminivora glycinivorella TaxID=1035111 RepID=UPI00200E3D23|nr:uncharacterized protein LOC125230635 isoform X2 [Leguminivora glycinivorella]
MPRKVSQFHWELAEIIQKAANIIDIHDIEYVIQYGCDDVDIFFSNMYLVTIRGKRNGSNIKKNIIIKCHIDLNQRENFRELYKRGHVFYNTVVTKLLEIQRTFKVIEGLKIKFPNCIYSSAEYNKEVLVLSQMVDTYSIHNRFLPISIDEAKLTLKNMAKLHALSFVWETYYSEEFDEIKKILSKNVQYSELVKLPKSMRYCYDTSVNVVMNPMHKDKLKALAGHLLAILQTPPPLQYSAICHGDCWINNILFKVKGTRPVEVMFVDYQLSRYASPVSDISYFLYMSTDRELLSQHYETLINVYYGTLAGVLRQCNLKVEQVYPENIFRLHLKEYSVLGLIEALVSMQIITADNEDAIKMTEIRYTQPEVENAGIDEHKFSNQNIFIERVNAIVNSFFQMDYSLTSVI